MNYNIPVAIKKGSDKCYAIKRNPRVYYHLSDPWNRGFYQVPDPKLFLTREGAEKFISENHLKDCEVVSGMFEPSQGFIEEPPHGSITGFIVISD